MKQKKPHKRRWRHICVALILLTILANPLYQLLHLALLTVQYRDEVYGLLNYSDDCHMPCFMDITPGQTTRDEAVYILDHHPDVTKYESGDTWFRIWLQGYDDWFHQANGRLTISLRNNVVTEIHVLDQVPVIAYFGILGLPDGDFLYSYIYVDKALILSQNCQSSYFGVLSQYSSLIFVAPDYLNKYKPLNPHRLFLYQDCPYFLF